MPIIPLSVDVEVNLIRNAIYSGTELSLGCVLTDDTGASEGLHIIASLEEALDAGYAAASPGYQAAAAFFSQSPRPQDFALYEMTAAEATSIPTAFANAGEAAVAAGRYIYAWALASNVRTDANILALAAAAEAATAVHACVLTDANVIDPAVTNDLASQLRDLGYTRTFATYHTQATEYPEVSILARLLGVDYADVSSSVTAKFKKLPGVTVQSQLTAAQLDVLNAKRCNVYALIGGKVPCYREGVVSAPDWFIDSRVNLDNFIEELRTELYNVFTSHGKVPYTVEGQTMLANAAGKICSRYTVNGVFAPRYEAAQGTLEGYLVKPATDIQFRPIWTATDSDRAQRKIPPLRIVCYEAGAIHRVVVNVEDIV